MTTLVDLLRWGAAGTLGEADAELLAEHLACIAEDDDNIDTDTLLAALREAFGEREAVLAELLAACESTVLSSGHYAGCLRGARRLPTHDTECSLMCVDIRAAIARAKVAR